MDAEERDILKVRDLYYKATTNKAMSDSFFNYLAENPKIFPSLYIGYTGMAYMIRANYSWNPVNKLSYFTKGKDYLNGAIEKDEHNIELRFLRFSVQTNAPAFLAYSSDIKTDKAVILAGYNLIKDEDLKSRIREYMKSSKVVTSKEKELFA